MKIKFSKILRLISNQGKKNYLKYSKDQEGFIQGIGFMGDEQAEKPNGGWGGASRDEQKQEATSTPRWQNQKTINK